MTARFVFAFGFALLVAGPVHGGNCIRDTYGNLVCDEHQCASDSYDRVFCAREGGNALRNQHGTVVCGIGYCVVDDAGAVKCSTRPGGGATMDQFGNVDRKSVV